MKGSSIAQQFKYENVTSLGLSQPLPIPSSVFTNFTMDFIESLSKSKGKLAIFAVVDRLTKYSHFMALGHPFLVQAIVQLFLENVFKWHGNLQSIISDKGFVFLNSFWREFFKLQGVEFHYSTVYHPWMDGQMGSSE